MAKKQSLVKNTLIVAVLSLGAKALGFIKMLLLSYFYGASFVSDAFNIALTIPDTIFSFVGNAVKTTFMPIYSQQATEDQSDQFLLSFLKAVFVVTLVLAVAGSMFTRELVWLFAPGFTTEGTALAVTLTRVSLWSIVALGVVNVLTAYLQLIDRFFWASSTALISNVAICMGIVASHYTSEPAMGMGVLAGAVLEAVVLLAICLNKASPMRIARARIDTPQVRLALSRSAPVMLGVGLNRLSVIVDKSLASLLFVGGIAALNYADTIVLFAKNIFAASITTSAYPQLTDAVSRSDVDEVHEVMAKSLDLIVLTTLPITVALMLYARPIVEFVFQRGAFDQGATRVTAGALLCYAIGLMAYSIRDYLIQVYYAHGNTRTPTANSMAGVAIKICLSILLQRTMGLYGLALSSSIAAFLIMMLMVVRIRKEVSFSAVVSRMNNLRICLAATLAVSVLSLVIHSFVYGKAPILLSTPLVLGAFFVGYIAIVYTFRLRRRRTVE